MSKAVVLLSGGIDSTVCLADAVNRFNGPENVIALTLFYGQKHAKELESAKAVAGYFGVQHVIKNLVVYGAHADDAAGNAYPDCSVAFYTALSQAVYEGTGHKVQLFAPLISSFKKGIVKKGLELGAPFHLTWSCYNGTEKACGKCGTCIDRKKAFEANGVKDPIEYAE